MVLETESWGKGEETEGVKERGLGTGRACWTDQSICNVARSKIDGTHSVWIQHEDHWVEIHGEFCYLPVQYLTATSELGDV